MQFPMKLTETKSDISFLTSSDSLSRLMALNKFYIENNVVVELMTGIKIVQNEFFNWVRGKTGVVINEIGGQETKSAVTNKFLQRAVFLLPIS